MKKRKIWFLCINSIVFFCILCSTSVWDITSGVVYMAFQKMRMKYFLERPPSVKIWNFLYSYALEIWFSHLKWILGSSSFMNIKYMTIFRFFHFSLEIFVFELHLSIRDQDWQFLREALLKYSSSQTEKNGPSDKIYIASDFLKKWIKRITSSTSNIKTCTTIA